MKTKHLITLTITVVVVLQLLVMPLAVAAETPQVSLSSEGNSISITQSYAATESASVLPKAINRQGQRYILSGSSTEVDPDYVKPKMAFTRTASSQVPLSGIDDVGSFFPAAQYVDEGDFKGEIGLASTNPFTIEERYETFVQQVDRVVTFYDLPDNDVSRLPMQQEFEVNSSAAPGATERRILTYTDVQYLVTGTDHLGLPDNYTAIVTYRGQEGIQELHHYDVTAHYQGELESIAADQMIVTGTYSPEPAAPVTPAPPAEEVPAPPVEQEFPFFPLVIAGSTAVVFLAAPLLYFFLLPNARLVRISATQARNNWQGGSALNRKGSPANKRKESSELVCRRRLVLKEGLAVFRVPPKFNILDGELYYLIIKPRLALKEGSVELVWQGRTMAFLPLACHTNVNFKEMLVTSTEAALMESGLLD